MDLGSDKTSNLTSIAALVLSCIIFGFTILQSCNSRFNEAMGGLDSRFQAIEKRFDRIDTTLVRMNNCIKHIKEDIKEIKKTMNDHSEQIKELQIDMGKIKENKKN